MKNVTLVILAIIISFSFNVHKREGSLTYPELGKRFPDFTLNDVQYYTKKKVSLKDFKGKWLILDCWNFSCGACVRAMPHMDSIQKMHPDQLQVMMVGYTGSQYVGTLGCTDNERIRTLYVKVRKEANIQLPTAYDSAFFHRFGIEGCPYIFIIDPKGIVRGMTHFLTKENIQDFLDGKTPEMYKLLYTLPAKKDTGLIRRKKEM